MKLFFRSSIVAAGALVFMAGIAAAEKPSIGVAEFRNKTNAGWWYSGVGWDLADTVTNELASLGSFTVVERANLEPVLREQDLADYGRVSKGTGAKIGKLTGAKYLVMGSLSSYEENVKGGKGGIGYKGIRLGGKKNEVYMAVDLRVVDTTSGEVAFTRTVEARTGGRGFNVGVFRSGFGGNLAKEEKTPAGKAIRACLIEIVDYLECAMVKQDSCMAEFDAKERKRRDSAKGSIKLD
ncbi:MAG: penicillin-binding protein activator LpoB [bacterium]|nr:penicillin-binding protein activator LpoB [bacterium]